MNRVRNIMLGCAMIFSLNTDVKAANVLSSSLGLCDFYDPQNLSGPSHNFRTILKGVVNSCTFSFSFTPYNTGIAKVEVSSSMSYETVENGRSVVKSTPLKPYGTARFDTGRNSPIVIENLEIGDPSKPGVSWVTVAYKYPQNSPINYKKVTFIFDLLFFDGTKQKVTKVVNITTE